MSTDDFDELVSRYLEDALREEDVATLLAALEKPPLSARFLEMTRLNAEIAGVLAAPVPDGAMVDLVRADIEGHLAATSTIPFPQRAELRRSFPKRVLAWAAIFLALAGVVAVWLTDRGQPGEGPTFVTAPPQPEVAKGPSLAAMEGDVSLLVGDAGGAVTPGEPWPQGAALATTGAASTAGVIFADRTRLDLAGGCVAVNRSGAAGQRVEVQRGRLKAAVQPQPPGQPFVFATAIAEVVVKGTALEVEVLDASHSRVIVIEGEVLVRRFSDGEEIDVRAGFHVLFGPTGELHTTANSHLPHHR